MINEVTSVIQVEISKAVVKDKGIREELEKQLKLTENEVETLIQNHVFQLIRLMPIATLHRVNLVLKIMSYHSNLTGDPLIHQLFGQLNEQILKFGSDDLIEKPEDEA